MDTTDGKKKRAPRKPPVMPGRTRVGANGRTWQNRLLGPPAHRYYRAQIKDETKGTWVIVQMPAEHRDPDPTMEKIKAELWFKEIEKALDQRRVIPVRRGRAIHTMTDLLVERYLAWLTTTNKDPDYIVNRRNLVTKWVLAAPAEPGTGRTTDGEMSVDEWGPFDSARWIDAAREGVGPARVEDLGVALAGMRDAAQRELGGVRWMEVGKNPLEGVKFAKRSTEKGTSVMWIPLEQRPTTAQVESLEGEVDRAPAWPWQPVQVRIGTRHGLRLAEQMGLRGVDVDFSRMVLRVIQTVGWARPKEGIPLRIKPVKTVERREVPMLGSVVEPLLVLVRASLGLPADATIEDVTAAQTLRRQVTDARDKITYDKKRRPVEPDEGFLFLGGTARQSLRKTAEGWEPDPSSPLVPAPPSKETYGSKWRPQRKESTWPDHLPWRNARHHTATWWPAVLINPKTGLPYEPEVYSAWLGHSLATYQAHYVKVGADDLESAAAQFADL
ncbi:MAG: hypothetical protein ACRDYV_07090 [Acidimicrobiia bacterium]